MKQYRIALFAALGVIVVLVAWYAVLWRPDGSPEGGAGKRGAGGSPGQYGAGPARNARAEQPKVKAEEAVFQKLVQALPDGPGLDQLMRTINSAAAKAGVSITTLGTPEPESWGTFTAPAPASAPATASAPTMAPTAAGPEFLSLSVDVNGTNAQILKLITALDKQPRIYVVESFGLISPVVGTSTGPSSGTSGASSGGSATLDVEAFYVSAASNNPTFPG